MTSLYGLLRPLLWKLDAECAHHAALYALRAGLVSGIGPQTSDANPMLAQKLFGLDFANPIGLSAGFDKNAQALWPLQHLGFGFIEAGTATLYPQKGNKRPRLFRLENAEAIINRFGFNNHGIAKILQQLRKRPTGHAAIGLNIGANKDSIDPIKDYDQLIEKSAAYVDYITLNISSPNTPGLRQLQDPEKLDQLLTIVKRATELAKSLKSTPIFVKISPDIPAGLEKEMIALLIKHQVSALIISNTSLSRPDGLGPMGLEAGGLSGKPIFDSSNKALKRFAQASQGRLALIGVGGIFSGEDAYKKIRAGACLVQLYTGLIYRGPNLIPQALKELNACLKRDGFHHISEAIGADL